MIGDVISSFAQAVTLYRRSGAGSVDDGRFIPSEQATSTIRVGVVPASGKDLERLPEGMRARAAVRVFSQVELYVHPAPDELAVDGVRYEVQSAAAWTAGGFWDCIAARKAVQP